ncbi:MAG: succinate dehydrogenase cytochrome b subunit [Verrucomicrobiales bacterium]
MHALTQGFCAACRSSVGRKWIVALSGILLLLFLAGHLAGNLFIYAGPEALNAYAKKLQSLGPLLWVIRVGLLAIAAVHVVTTIALTLENRAARGGVGYARNESVKATFSSRIMIWSGLVILAFIIYHVLHFTLGVIEPEFLDYHDGDGNHDVYRMVVTGFSSWTVSGFYILAMGLLCSHLSHGFSSIFQTLGLRTDRNWPLIVKLGQAYAAVIFVGNISIPISVLTGFVSL